MSAICHFILPKDNTIIINDSSMVALRCRKCSAMSYGSRGHVLRWAKAHAQREHGGAAAVVCNDWAFYQRVPGFKRGTNS